MLQLTNPNILMTHAATLAEYRLADFWPTDIESLIQLACSDSNALALTFLKSTENPVPNHTQP